MTVYRRVMPLSVLQMFPFSRQLHFTTNEPSAVMYGVRILIKRTAALLKREMAGEVLIPGVLNAEEIEKQTAARKPQLWLI